MTSTRFVVEDMPMYDSNTGKEGGVILHFTGDARRHPWPSRKGEFLMDGAGVARMKNGDVYTGEFSLGMFHGNGKMNYANGDLYEGQWVNHFRHGYGMLEFKDSNSSYVGNFRHGDKDGAGEELFADGSTFAGMFRDGKRHGVGRIKVKSSGDIIDGVFADGQLEGFVTVTYGHGDVFVGKFVMGKPHGEGKYTQVDSGDVYTEVFYHGTCIEGVLEPSEDPVGDLEKYSEKRETYGVKLWDDPPPAKKVCAVKYHDSGDEYCGEWLREASGSNRRGVRHGHGKLINHSTGEVYEGNFERGQREGYGCLWYAPSNGEGNDETGTRRPVVYRGDFHLDVQDGYGSVEYSDGTITKQFFSKGVAHGLCHEYHEEMPFSLPAEVHYRPSVISKMFVDGVEQPDIVFDRLGPECSQLPCK